MGKKFLMLQFCLCSISLIWSQTPDINSVPSIGKIVPEIIFSNLINSDKQTMQLSELRGKLVILDFYGTWCGSCQPGIPKLDSLQKVLGKKLQVIVVCHDPNRQIVEKTIRSRWKDLNIALPFVLTDSTLNNLFPHKMVPHEVWIAPNGNLLATTDAEALTYENIINAINEQSFHLAMKVDQMDFNRNKPLFENGNGGSNKSILFRSLVSKHIDGIVSGAGENIDTINGMKRVYFLNMPIIQLYQSAAHQSLKNRLVLDVRDSGKLIPNEKNKQDWHKANTYCYEISYPLSLPYQNIQEKWLADLNTAFRLNGRLEKRLVACWALERLYHEDTIIYSQTNQTAFTEMMSKSGIFKGKQVYAFVNKPIQFLLYILNSEGTAMIVDETGIERNIDIDIPIAHVADIPTLNKDLMQYGLKLKPVTRKVEMLVISDK